MSSFAIRLPNVVVAMKTFCTCRFFGQAMFPPARFLPRRDLTRRMLEAVKGHPLTVVAAPMGYGKTTLARALADTAEGRVYYYATPPGPHDGRYLWRDIDHKRLLDLFMMPEYGREAVFLYDEVFGAVTSLPWRTRMQNPLGYLVFLAFFLVMWNDSRSAPMLAEAEEYFNNSGDIPEPLRKRLQGELAVLRGLQSLDDLTSVCEHYAEACVLMENSPSAILSKESAWNYGSPSVSFLYLRKPGTYDDLIDLASERFHLYVTLSGGAGRFAEKTARAEYLLERGELDLAEPLLRDSLRLCGADKQANTALVVSFCLARLAVAQGSPERATRIMAELRPKVERLDILEYYEGFDMALGYINACLGRNRGIAHWLREGVIFDPPHNSLPQLFGLGLTIHAKSLLLRGEYHRLAAVSREIPTCTGQLESVFAKIHGKTLEAIALWHTKGPDGAMPPLEEALDLSRPDSIILPLAEYGGRILPLLQHRESLVPPDAHLTRILPIARRIARISGFAQKSGGRDQLTPREREFMRCVADGLSNISIAKKMGVAEVTVKKALVTAYAKLGAVNRVEAARRFLEKHGSTETR